MVQYVSRHAIMAGPQGTTQYLGFQAATSEILQLQHACHIPAMRRLRLSMVVWAIARITFHRGVHASPHAMHGTQYRAHRHVSLGI